METDRDRLIRLGERWLEGEETYCPTCDDAVQLFTESETNKATGATTVLFFCAQGLHKVPFKSSLRGELDRLRAKIERKIFIAEHRLEGNTHWCHFCQKAVGVTAAHVGSGVVVDECANCGVDENTFDEGGNILVTLEEYEQRT